MIPTVTDYEVLFNIPTGSQLCRSFGLQLQGSVFLPKVLASRSQPGLAGLPAAGPTLRSAPSRQALSGLDALDCSLFYTPLNEDGSGEGPLRRLVSCI